MDLTTIAHPIHQHLDAFEEVFRSSLRSNISLVDLVIRYIVRQKGKRIRPILVLLAAEACGGVTQKSYRAATLVEILHTATLVHDDVVDSADTRRGIASINAVWKNKVAVLIGDYLLARGLLLSLDNDDFAFLKITSTAVKRMSEGEIHQVQKNRERTMDEATYLRIIGDKTASLISTCCEIGSVSATGDTGQWKLLREYGENVGLAFQIRDDLLDYTGRKSLTGKPTAHDMKEGKLTLPIIHALGQAPRDESQSILKMVKKGGKKLRVDEVVDFVTRYRGIEYATIKARELASTAKEKVASLAESPAKSALLHFADFVVERAK